jgi:hypothetical protein
VRESPPPFRSVSATSLLPEPRILPWLAFPRIGHSVQQGARFSRIARDAFAEDLVATERVRKLDAVAMPKQRQPARIPRFHREVGDVERDHAQAARHLPNLGVKEAIWKDWIAAIFDCPDPDDSPIPRNALQRPRRSQNFNAVMQSGKSRTCISRSATRELRR